jgi:cellulose synthase/poly-beta-1,6-N-acetylglucosamine synthase-like glycosyltransferase
MDRKIVTIVIPVYNEENFIIDCIESIINQNIGFNKIDLIIIDGGSEDKTIEVLNDYVINYKNIKLLKNPNKYTCFAFNIGIKASNPECEFITFLNCHAIYSIDRIKKTLNHFIKDRNVDAVGGYNIAVPSEDGIIPNTLALIQSSIFGTGSQFRSTKKENQYADTASGCMYRKNIFDTVGNFNEKLIYSNDLEFNKRLILSGKKLLCASDIITNYKVRSKTKEYFIHTFRRGRGIFLLKLYSDLMPLPIRHLVPFSWLWINIFSLILYLMEVINLATLFFLPIIYFLISLIISAKISIKKNNFLYFLSLPLMFATYHIVYGVGTTFGLFMYFVKNNFKSN